MAIQLQTGETILFVGDSITDCDRGNSLHAPLGHGYVRLFSDLLTIREPTKTLSVLNRGIGGNTVEDLRSRWQDDVLSHHPDWLSIHIGINDVNRNLCGTDSNWLSPAMYEGIYRELLALAHQALPACQVLLISPFFLSRDSVKGSYRARVLEHLTHYTRAVEALHLEFQTRYLSLQAVFNEQLAHRHPDVFAPEPVHPNQTGHLLIAESVYTALS